MLNTKLQISQRRVLKILQYLKKKSNNENLKTYTIFGRLFLLFFLKILCGSGGV